MVYIVIEEEIVGWPGPSSKYLLQYIYQYIFILKSLKKCISVVLFIYYYNKCKNNKYYIQLPTMFINAC